MKKISSIIIILAFGGIGCNRNDQEAKALEKKLTAAEEKNKSLALDLEKATEENNKLKAKIKKLSETPEAIFRAAFESLEKWKESNKNSNSESDLFSAEAGFMKIIKKFPNSRLVRRSRSSLRIVKKEKKKLKARKRELEEAVKLKNITGQDLVINKNKYKGKVIIRDIFCHEIKLSDFVYTTGVAEINLRAGKKLTATCCFGNTCAYGGKGYLQLHLTKAQARHLLDNYRASDDTGEGYRIPDVELWFTGKIASGSDPIFFVKRFP